MPSKFTKLKENKVFKAVLSLSREIIMIVIGIYLAFQIDDWANERNDTNDLKRDLAYVLEDLASDKKEILLVSTQKEGSITHCTALLDNFKLNRSMDRDDIVVSLGSILTTHKFINSKSGFERIKSSPLYESIDFFPVRNQIREYNDILEELRFTENFINRYIASLSLEMSKTGKLLCVFDYIRTKKDLPQSESELPFFDLNELLVDNKPLQAVLHKYEFDAQSLIKHYSRLHTSRDKLITVIYRYQKKEQFKDK